MQHPFLKKLLLAVLCLAAFLPGYTQVAAASAAPQGINYQSVARNGAGQILTNQPIGLRVTIHDSTSAGAIVYQEHHTVVTNAFGTFSVVIGGGSIILGNFGGIQWGTANKYMQVEMDFAGGNNYTNMGTSQLLSVPFALYAGTSAADIQNIKYDTSGVLNVQTAAQNIVSTKPVWLAGGNSNLSTTNNWIGTIDNRDVIIKRGNVESIRYTQGGALLATGDNTGATPATGAGKRMEWIPAKGAFRAGTVTGAQWDDAYIGSGSMAMGTDAVASGANAIAMGNGAVANAANAVAIGNGVIAKNANSMVVGNYNDTSATAVDSVSPSDILFQVGSGSSSARSNALTVSRTGKVVADKIIANSLTLSDTIMTVSANFTVNPTHSFYIINSTIAPAEIYMGAGQKIGQMIIIEVVSSNSGNVRFNSNSSTRLQCSSSGSPYLNNKGTMTLIWDGTYWTQTARSDN
ncbi:MAG: hypothetical protein JST90_04165 [Bacteroidetes bacterium]|nr:hypothetical protein [Bacteroidota bacterium]